MNIQLINPENRYEDPIVQILRNRGVNDDPEEYLKHSWAAVQSPYDLDNIVAAAEMILKYMRGKATVAVLVDSDMDGFSSAAILYNYFKMQELYGDFGTLPEIKFLFHEDKSHGLDDTSIMKQLRDVVKPALLIVPDASGSNDQYSALNNLGIEICVIDHHEMEDKGDGIKTIVVNNQQSKSYRNKALSGAGMVFQLCRVLDDKLPFQCAEFHLDICALGLAADVMDFRSPETRFLIMEGLKNINSPFLDTFRNELCYQVSRQYDPALVKFNYKTVSWNIAPLINAVNRIGTMNEKELIFKALLLDLATTEVPSGKRGATENVSLATEALRQATNAKSRQARRQDKLVEAINAAIQEDRLDLDKVIIVTIDDFTADQRALSGLIANKFIDWYKKPVMLLFKNEENNTFNGSLRCPENVTAYEEFRDQVLQSKLVLYSSGHQYAAGVGVKAGKVQELRDYFNKKYEDVNTSSTLKVDFIVPATDGAALEDLAEALDSLVDYWGQGIKQPLVCVERIPLTRLALSLFKPTSPNPTLSIKLPQSGSCIKFRSSQEEFDSLILPMVDGVEQYYLCDVVGELEVNDFRGTRTPQIKIVDYQLAGVQLDF